MQQGLDGPQLISLMRKGSGTESALAHALTDGTGSRTRAKQNVKRLETAVKALLGGRVGVDRL